MKRKYESMATADSAKLKAEDTPSLQYVKSESYPFKADLTANLANYTKAW